MRIRNCNARATRSRIAAPLRILNAIRSDLDCFSRLRLRHLSLSDSLRRKLERHLTERVADEETDLAPTPGFCARESDIALGISICNAKQFTII